jgi:hypothetical protein
MSDYASRVSAIKSEQARLAQQQVELAAQRRTEIGKLAEKLGVLEADDELLTGVLIDLKRAIESDHPRLKEWREIGARFRSRPEPQRKHASQTARDENGARPSSNAQVAHEL